ncbi:hypothetical protein LX32DRAFT_441932 [Colletotrichum zoysiae]|uniref:Uncharacterized protein n=1 Tax=Colletotrichum zoysiae TaxID=1216348 RepID=A0AAD9HRW5_9PEZI|nr:hypothetical protein LX32DRAFT_441932 [Colletotrichum zoysiae]
MSANDIRLHSEQLLRFAQASNSPHVTADDIALATKCVDDIPQDATQATYFYTSYPVEWTQTRAIKNFLRGWRHRVKTYYDNKTTEQQPLAAPTLHAPVPDTPTAPLAPVKPRPREPSPQHIDTLTSGLSALDLHGTPTPRHVEDLTTLDGNLRIGPIDFGPRPQRHKRTSSIFSWAPTRPTEPTHRDTSPQDQTTASIETSRRSPRQLRTPAPSSAANMPSTPLTAEAASTLMAAAMAAQRHDMQTDFAAMMREAFRINDANNQNQQANRESTPRDNSRPAPLRSADVGLFHPEAKDPNHLGMVSDGKLTVYTDVYAFTDRLTDLAASRGDAAIREIWTQCLQGSALVWYSQILTPADRDLYRTATINTITAKLLERFKPHYGDAMRRWKQASYTLQDVHGAKDPMIYVQTMLRDAKACGIMDIEAQLRAVHESFDGTIQSLIPPPDEYTTLEGFLQSIRRHESTMRTIAAERITAQRPTPSHRQPQYNTSPYSPTPYTPYNHTAATRLPTELASATTVS